MTWALFQNFLFYTYLTLLDNQVFYNPSEISLTIHVI